MGRVPNGQKRMLLLIVVPLCVRGQSFFSPVWHTPNTNAKDGTPCSELRPPRTVQCPTFCIKVETFCKDCHGDDECCQSAVEEGCMSYGDHQNCPDGDYLFPDGTCSNCAKRFDGDGSTWQEKFGHGTIWCENEDGKILKVHNPCDCDGHSSYVPADGNGSKYRPCQIGLDTDVPQYYGGFDFDGELTKEACATARGFCSEQEETCEAHDHEYTCVDTKAKGGCEKTEDSGCSTWSDGCVKYPFPMLHLNDEDESLGFLECPKASREDAGYYKTWGWILTYCVYGLGAIGVGLFALYKRRRERNHQEFARQFGGVRPEAVVSYASTALMTVESESEKPEGISRAAMGNIEISGGGATTQIGISNDWFGFINFWYLVFLSVYLFVFICVQCADIYGLLWWACPDVVEFMAGNDCPYTWREGLTCAALCVFQTIPSDGSLTHWPYWNIPPGHLRYQQIYICSWHIAVLWFFILIMTKDHIRPWYRVKGSLSTCKYVQVTQPEQESIVLEEDQQSAIGRIHRFIAKCKLKLLGMPMINETCKVESYDGGHRYFDFRCQRYSWNNSAQMFVAANLSSGWTHERIAHFEKGLSSTEAGRRCLIVGHNAIRVPIPGLASAWFSVLFDFFFLYQMSGILMAFHFWYFLFGIVVLAMALYGVGVKVWAKRSSLKRIKVIAEASTDIYILRDEKWQLRNSECLVPGDACRLVPGQVPCDIALVKGRVVVDESSLTGEPNPVPKISLEAIPKLYTKQGEDAKYTVYSGTSIQAVSSSKDEDVVGIVVSTGAQTNKGKLVRGILYPAPIEFKFDQHWTVVFGLLIVYAVFCAIVTFYFINWKLDGWFYAVFTVLQLISPLLPATFILAQTKAVSKLKKSDIHCVHPQRTVVSGKVKVACFDKTGTLTESGLHYAGVIPIKDGKFTSEASPTVSHALGCCHELDLVDTTGCKVDERDLHNGKLCVGNEVDKRMFFGSGYGFSPIEPLTFCSPDGTVLKTLRRFEFDRSTMTMTTIVENQSTKERLVFCKGNPDFVASHCLQNSLPHDWIELSKSRASEGFYVLGLAFKSYEGLADVNQMPRTSVENKFQPLGLLEFRNSLKEEASDVIAEIKGGNIRPVMITGDAPETALHIARECGLSTSRRVFVGSAPQAATLGGEAEVSWADAKTGEVITDIYHHLDELEEGVIDLLVTGKAFENLCSIPADENRVYRRLATRRTFDEKISTPGDDSFVPESKMDDILRYTRIFARMKPEQKVETVRLHMKTATTSMCGDGANDAAALQRSHAGVALASGCGGDEAALVAHFATPSESLRAYLSVISEGRAALATLLHAYKFLISYGQITAFLHILSFYFAFNMCEAAWLTVDIVINVGYSFAIMQGQKSEKRLSPYRPTASLFGGEILTSVISHLSINLSVMIFLVGIMYTQDWYRCKELDGNLVDVAKWWLKGDNYEGALMMMICLFQWSSSAAVFNFGFDYRRAWLKNWMVPVYWGVLMISWSTAILSGPNGWGCLYHMNCGDNSMLIQWSDLQLTNDDHEDFYYWKKPYDHPNRNITLAPIGCSCLDTIDPSDDTCQAEYVDCKESHFNQIYHHNIFPRYYRFFIWGVISVGILLNFLVEGLLVVGPMRRRLRERRDRNLSEKEWRRRVIVGSPFEHGPSLDGDYETSFDGRWKKNQKKESSDGLTTSSSPSPSPPTDSN